MLFMMFWNHGREVELYSIFVALLQQGIVAAGLESSQTDPAMSAWHSPAPRLCFLCSLPLVFSLFTLPLTVSLLSVFFFFIRLPLFLCLSFLPLTLFSLFLILALTSIPPFFRLLFQQEKGSVGGPSPTGNTPIIAFWSLWHDKVCQGKAAQLHAPKDTRARTHTAKARSACVKSREHTKTRAPAKGSHRKTRK